MLKDNQYSNAIPNGLRQIAKLYQKKAEANFNLNQEKINEYAAKRVIKREESQRIDHSEMTVEQNQELINGPKIPTKKEIETFFEEQVGQKVIFQGQPIIVKEVFVRSNGIAVEFFCPSSKIQALVFSSRERDFQKLRPYSIIKVGEVSFEIIGEIQLGISEKFKVLFPC